MQKHAVRPLHSSTAVPFRQLLLMNWILATRFWADLCRPFPTIMPPNSALHKQFATPYPIFRAIPSAYSLTNSNGQEFFEYSRSIYRAPFSCHPFLVTRVCFLLWTSGGDLASLQHHYIIWCIGLLIAPIHKYAISCGIIEGLSIPSRRTALPDRSFQMWSDRLSIFLLQS
jgi:hypothetical protein